MASSRIFSSRAATPVPSDSSTSKCPLHPGYEATTSRRSGPASVSRCYRTLFSGRGALDRGPACATAGLASEP